MMGYPVKHSGPPLRRGNRASRGRLDHK